MENNFVVETVRSVNDGKKFRDDLSIKLNEGWSIINTHVTVHSSNGCDPIYTYIAFISK